LTIDNFLLGYVIVNYWCELQWKNLSWKSSLRAALSREHCVAGSNPENRKGLLKAWIASLRSQRQIFFSKFTHQQLTVT
jgi:hypothetical protein